MKRRSIKLYCLNLTHKSFLHEIQIYFHSNNIFIQNISEIFLNCQNNISKSFDLFKNSNSSKNLNQSLNYLIPLKKDFFETLLGPEFNNFLNILNLKYNNFLNNCNNQIQIAYNYRKKLKNIIMELSNLIYNNLKHNYYLIKNFHEIFIIKCDELKKLIFESENILNKSIELIINILKFINDNTKGTFFLLINKFGIEITNNLLIPESIENFQKLIKEELNFNNIYKKIIIENSNPILNKIYPIEINYFYLNLNNKNKKIF